jgi:hypothetical protein
MSLLDQWEKSTLNDDDRAVLSVLRSTEEPPLTLLEVAKLANIDDWRRVDKAVRHLCTYSKARWVIVRAEREHSLVAATR